MARTIKAGDLRQVITLLRPRGTVTAGRRTVTWDEIPGVHAAKSDVSGREFWEAQAYHAEDTVTFTIRWRSDINATWRISHGGVTYSILEISHLGNMRDYMRIKTRAVGAGGV